MATDGVCSLAMDIDFPPDAAVAIPITLPPEIKIANECLVEPLDLHGIYVLPGVFVVNNASYMFLLLMNVTTN